VDRKKVFGDGREREEEDNDEIIRKANAEKKREERPAIST